MSHCVGAWTDEKPVSVKTDRPRPIAKTLVRDTRPNADRAAVKGEEADGVAEANVRAKGRAMAPLTHALGAAKAIRGKRPAANDMVRGVYGWTKTNLDQNGMHGVSGDSLDER